MKMKLIGPAKAIMAVTMLLFAGITVLPLRSCQLPINIGNGTIVNILKQEAEKNDPKAISTFLTAIESNEPEIRKTAISLLDAWINKFGETKMASTEEVNQKIAEIRKQKIINESSLKKESQETKLYSKSDLSKILSSVAKDDPDENVKESAKKTLKDLEEFSPSEFFPYSPDFTLSYEIEIGETKPLWFSEICWPVGTRRAIYSNRGTFLATVLHPEQKSFNLDIKVKDFAEQQGHLRYPIGVELQISKDELGIFENTKKIYFAITNEGRFMANLVTTFDRKNGPADPNRFGGEDGSSSRLIFFGDKPFISIGLQNSPETFLFFGADFDFSRELGIEVIRFQRQIKASKQEAGKLPNEFDRAFVEDLWYAKAYGLIKLEQKIEGKTSMTWRLRTPSLKIK